MEQSNVNNLNGVPNFGHGFPEEEAQEIAATVEEVEVAEEVVEQPTE
jgi:hypothetical protein